MLCTTQCAGRLCNRVFQNAAAELLARKFDVQVEYGCAAECEALGLGFQSGRGLMHGPREAVTDDSFESILARPALETTLVVGRNAYFQTPWMAMQLFHSLRDRPIAASNPFDSRDATFVHVRLDDATRFAPPVEAVARAVERAGASDVLIASDSLQSDAVHRLIKQFSAAVVDDTAVRTLQRAAATPRVVATGGTFGWMCGALAAAQSDARLWHVPSAVAWHGDIFECLPWQHVL